MMAFLPIPTPVYCGSLPIVQSVFSCPLFIRYGIAGNRVTDRVRGTFHTCGIAPPRVGLEHPRPHAVWNHRLSDSSAGEPSDYRQGESSAGETPFVRKPVAGEAPRR